MIPFLAPGSQEEKQSIIVAVVLLIIYVEKKKKKVMEKKEALEKKKQTTIQEKQETNCTWHLVQKNLQLIEILFHFEGLQLRLLMCAQGWLQPDHISLPCPFFCWIKTLLWRCCFSACFGMCPQCHLLWKTKSAKGWLCTGVPARTPKLTQLRKMVPASPTRAHPEAAVAV